MTVMEEEPTIKLHAHLLCRMRMDVSCIKNKHLYFFIRVYYSIGQIAHCIVTQVC